MFENPVWYAHATYNDGTEIYREFPYMEGNNYNAECERQQALEETVRLIESVMNKLEAEA